MSQNCWRVSCPQHAHASAKIQLSAICDKDWQSRLCANPGRLAGRGLSLVCSAWRQGHFQTQAGDLFEAGVGVHE